MSWKIVSITYMLIITLLMIIGFFTDGDILGALFPYALGMFFGTLFYMIPEREAE